MHVIVIRIRNKNIFSIGNTYTKLVIIFIFIENYNIIFYTYKYVLINRQGVVCSVNVT